LILEYEKRLQELVKTHEEESYQLKQRQNDKIEELLQRITEINKRYWELVPELDLAKEKIKELESQLEDACHKLTQQEEKQKKTYLEMYNQGQEAGRLERENKVMDIARQGPSRISVPELLEELQVTKNELENIKAMYRQLMEAKNKSKIDPEITLQFLKSAIYYFLTDKENNQGHLKAIQSILGFTPNEISSIDKARLS
jgi:chromosome segregation ATPase